MEILGILKPQQFRLTTHIQKALQRQIYSTPSPARTSLVQIDFDAFNPSEEPR